MVLFTKYKGNKEFPVAYLGIINTITAKGKSSHYVCEHSHYNSELHSLMMQKKPASFSNVTFWFMFPVYFLLFKHHLTLKLKHISDQNKEVEKWQSTKKTKKISQLSYEN